MENEKEITLILEEGKDNTKEPDYIETVNQKKDGGYEKIRSDVDFLAMMSGIDL